MNGGNADGDDASDSAPSELGAPPSGSSVVAPVNLAVFIDNFCLFLDSRRFGTMNQDNDNLDFVDARFDGRHDNDLLRWMKRSLVLDRNMTLFLESDEVELDMPSVCCFEEHEYAARLSTLVVYLKSVSGLSDQVNVCTVSDWPYDVFPFLDNSGRWRRNCIFGRRVRISRRLVLASWHNVEIFDALRLLTVRNMGRFPNGGAAMSSVEN